MSGTEPANLYALFRARAPSSPAAVFLEPPEGPSLGYADLDTHTARLQAWLAAEGVGAGDRVVAQVEKSPTAVLLYLACLRRGAVFVPLNTAYTAEEVAFFLGDAEPRLFVCDPERRSALAPAARAAGVARLRTLDAAGAGSLADYLGCDPDPAVAPRAPDDLAAILYTSGTTGRSKGAMLTHRNLATNARTLVEVWHWQPDDVLLHVLPIHHAHGLFVALHCALLGGSRVLFEPRFDAATAVRALSRATVFMGVPTHYTRLLEQPELDRTACSGVRLFVSGSAPLLAGTHRAFEERTGHRILERYGMTEAGMITSNPYDGERRAGSVGFPLPGVETRIVGADGAPLPPGEPGLLEIRGPNVFAGYWRLPEKTREEVRPDGFFATGDLAERAPDGRLTLVGRARDLVISGGLNVYPKEVEEALDALPGVRESAVIGLPHPDFGEGVTAVVVAEGDPPPSEAALIEGLAEHLARFKQPKRIFVVDALPRNAMGKVQKAALRERYASTYEGS